MFKEVVGRTSLAWSSLSLLKTMRSACFCWLFIFFQVRSAGIPSRDSDIVYITVNARVVTCNNDFLFNNGIAVMNRPMFFAISFSLYFICSFQFRFSSRKIPRNFIGSVRAISRLFIFSFGKASGISSFFARFVDKKSVWFFYIESLFETKNSLIFC